MSRVLIFSGLLLSASALVKGQNVGIGTSMPQAKLHIFGPEAQLWIENPNPPAAGTRNVVLFSRGGTIDWDMGTDNNGAGNTIFWFGDMTDYRMVLEKGTGNVGIGTTTPQTRLHVHGSGDVTGGIRVTSTGTGSPTINFYAGTATPNAGHISFGDNTGWKFHITRASDGIDMVTVQDNGNVGIGTTTPAQRLHVVGNIRLDGVFMPAGNSGLDGQVLVSKGPATPPAWEWKGVPSGVIVMYSGPWNFDATGLGTGPLTGWALCNGQNGTPNLTDRFVMGTTSSGNLGTTGGSNFYTLTVSQLPPHTHGVRAIFHGHDSEGNDNCGTGTAEGRVFYGDDNIWPNCGNPNRVTFPTDPTGSGDPIDNRPAFIQLAFIMKL